VPKGNANVGTTSANWPTSVTILENYLYPTKNLEEIEKYWLRVAEDHPDSLAAHESLAGIYRLRAAATSEPRRKAGWLDRVQMENEKVIELARKLTRSATDAQADEH
jgi:hypothetical protein